MENINIIPEEGFKRLEEAGIDSFFLTDCKTSVLLFFQ